MVFSRPSKKKEAQKKARKGRKSDEKPELALAKNQPTKDLHNFARNHQNKFLGKRSLDVQQSQDVKGQPPKRQRPTPSAEALDLSKQLLVLSREKKLDEALRLYKDPANDAIRDDHHLCIVVDCCAKCGRIDEGEKLFKESEKSGKKVNVETKTALMKGFAHSGQMAKAYALFESMCKKGSRSERPSVRTMNTLLRGCLWSACTFDEDGNASGGVVTAEKAWELCRTIQEKDPKSIMFDVSSYEYAIALLCQALRTDDANDRIHEMKSFFEVSEISSDIPQSVSETLALSHLSLARSFALLGEPEKAKGACKDFLLFANVSRKSLTDQKSVQGVKGRYAVKQGKGDKGARRDESNSLYRNHRIDEAEREARVILELCDAKGLATAPRQLARRLATRLIVLSGGGSTSAENMTGDNDDTGERTTSKSLQIPLLNTLYSSYGLHRILDIMAGSTSPANKFLRRRDCNRILGSIGLQGGIVAADGYLDFDRIFRVGIGEDKHKAKQPKRKGGLEIELGSGFGEWIVQKARQTPEAKFLAVELRADRVGQTFAKTAVLAGTTPVDNICIVGAECKSFISEYIRQDSISAIYINHPEPPTQTFGADSLNLDLIANGGPEPAHMISSSMLCSVARCLSQSGDARLVIVTDNRWYGRLICATLAKVTFQEKNLLTPCWLQDPSFKVVETFPAGSDRPIPLYEGQPNESIGHPKPDISGSCGVTYFDRLWRSGAGSHAEKTSRFIIVVNRSAKA